MGNRGRRYDVEPKLNLKKVFAVIIAIAVIIMFIFVIKNILSKGKDTGRITSSSYFAVYADNKWGVIDNTGSEVISPSYQEMVIVPNNKKDVFLCIYDINTTTGEYKTKALNSNNEEIFTEYSQVEALENFDENNNVWYEDDVLKVQKDGKYGLINLSGKEILPCEYDIITVVAGLKNSILVQKDGMYGIVNDEGTKMIDTTYTQILKLGDEYTDGYIVVDQNGKYGVVDSTGKQLLENDYEKVEQIYGKDMYVVDESGKQELVNSSGEVLLNKGYDTITQIYNYSTSGVAFVKDNKYGAMTTTGEVKVQNVYDDIKCVKENIFIAKKVDNYGVIDGEGNIKIDFTYSSITYNEQAGIFVAENEDGTGTVYDGDLNSKLTGIVSEVNEEKGYLKIRIDDTYKYYNFKFEEKDVKEILSTNTLYLSKQNGKYGFVDSKGNVVVDYTYDDAIEQNEYGYVAVKKDGKWGSIDMNGNVVIEPTYNLDNNYVIDFIGKWHLGQDINMNYYCEK